MCGRYTVISKLKIIEQEFRTDVSEIMERWELNPNVSPGDQGLIITNTEPDKLQMATFGLTPHWAKKQMYLINARSEGDHNKANDPNYTGARGIIQKPAFRKAIRSQRCLVIADAFVEGSTKHKLREPHLVYKSSSKRPFAMAGIWDTWIHPESQELIVGFAIITTASTPLLQKIPHHRSPKILSTHEEQAWLNNDMSLNEVTEMLYPPDDSEFNAYPISETIKSPRNKNPECLRPKGKLLRQQFDYVFTQDLDLQGMGETSARRRRANEIKNEGDQLDLFA